MPDIFDQLAAGQKPSSGGDIFDRLASQHQLTQKPLLTPQQVAAQYQAHIPKIPAGVTPEAVEKFQQDWLTNPDDKSIPQILTNRLANLPLDQREAHLNAHEQIVGSKLSSVGRAAILQRAYQLNAKMPLPSAVIGQNFLQGLSQDAGVQVDPEVMRAQGVVPAVAQAKAGKQKRIAQHEQASYLVRSGELPQDYDTTAQRQAAQQKAYALPHASVGEALSAPGRMLDLGVGTLVAGSPQPNVMSALAERLGGEGAGAQYEQVPGEYAKFARTLGGFAEPSSLATMGVLGPVSKSLGALASTGLFAALMGPQVIHAGGELLHGRPGEAAGVTLGLAGFGLFHGAEGVRTKSELKAFYNGKGELSPETAAKLDTTFGYPPGTSEAVPDLARENAYRALYPKKYAAEQKAQANAEAQRQALAYAQQNAVRQQVPGEPPIPIGQGARTDQPVPFGARSPLTQPEITPQEVIPNALPIPSAETQISSAGGTGENLPGSGQRVRPGQQGAEPAGTLPTEPIRQEAVGAQQTPGTTQGKVGVTRTPKNTEVPFHYEVRDASELTPSHTESGTETPGYNQGMQPRDLSRPAEQAKIEDIAQKLEFARVADAPTTADGAPLIGPDGHVESGNGRTLGILRARAKYPEKYARYVADLKSRAAEFGVDPSQVKSPVLVRVNDIPFISDGARESFAREAGESTVQRMSASETAAADSRALHASGALMRYNPNLDLTAAGNQDFVSRFMAQVPRSEHSAFQGDTGELSTEGKNRILSAIVAAAFDDKATVERLVSEPNPETKSVGNALRRAANGIAVLKQAIKAGTAHPLDLSQALVEAAHRYKDIKNRGVTVEEDLQNPDVFGGELAPEVEALLHAFETKNTSGKVTTRSEAQISKLLNYYLDGAFKQGDPSQVSESGVKPATKLELLDAAMRRIDREESSGNLFEEPAQSGQQPPAAVGKTGRAANTPPETTPETGQRTLPAEKSKSGEKLADPRTEQAAKLRAEALANLKKKGGLTAGIDPTSLPDYIKLAYSYLLDGLVKVDEVKAELKKLLPDLSDLDFKSIYTGAKKLYQATVTAGDPDAPLAEPFPGTADEKYVGSRNVKVPGYSIETIEALRRDYARNKAAYEAQKEQRTIAELQQSARDAKTLPAEWWKDKPENYLDPVKITQIHNATNFAREEVRLARAEGDPGKILEAEKKLTRYEAQYQAVANLWGKTGVALKQLGLEDAIDPQEAIARVNDLFQPKPREVQNRAAKVFTFTPQEQVDWNSEKSAILTILKEKMRLSANPLTLPAEVFAEALPHLVKMGKIALRVAGRGFENWKEAVSGDFNLDDAQMKQIYDAAVKETPKKAKTETKKATRSAMTPEEAFGPSPEVGVTRTGPQLGLGVTEGTTGEFQRTGSGKAGAQTGLPGTTETTTGEFKRTGSGRAGVQTGLEGTTPEMTTTPAEGFRIPNAPTPEAVQAQLGETSEFIPEGAYKDALKRIEEAKRTIPNTPTADETKLAMRDTQVQGALSDLGLYHLEQVSNAIADGKLKESSLRSEWNKRVKTDVGDLATKAVLNDVWNSLRTNAERKAGVRATAADIIRRNMTRGLSEKHIDAFADDLSKIDESDPRYYDKLDTLARKYMALSRSGTENFIQNWLAYRRANILSSPRTIAKVLVSHGIFLGAEELAKFPAAAMDLYLSKRFGTERTTYAPRIADIANAAYQALTRGSRESYKIARYGERAAERRGVKRIGSANVNETIGEIQVAGTGPGSALLNAYCNGITRMHSAAYRPFKVYAAARSIADQARVIVENQISQGQPYEVRGPDGEVWSKGRRIQELIDNPTEEMAIQATLDAEDATFLNENRTADAVGNIPGAQVVFPIRKVPFNIFQKSVEYGTGLRQYEAPSEKARAGRWFTIWNYLSNDFKAKLAADGVTRKQFSQTFGRQTVGIGLIGLGALGASYGVVHGVDLKHKLGKAFFPWAGERKEADISALPPVGTLGTVGATLHQLHTSKAPGDKPYWQDIIQLSMENPVVRAADQYTNMRDPSGAQLGANTAFSFVVPFSQLVSDVAEGTDTKMRKTSGPGYDFTREIMNKTPGLREKLPVKPGEPPLKFIDPLNIRKAVGR